MATSTPKPGGAKPKRAKRPAKRKTAKVDAAPAEEEIIVRQEEPPRTNALAMLQRGVVRQSDVTDFLRQLIMLLEAGTPLLKSLRVLSERGKRPERKALVADIMQYVEAGNPLWQSFDRHPRYFDTVFVNLVKASEASGTLVTVLKRLTAYRQERALLAKRVRASLIYPVLLVLACFGVTLVLSFFVVPEFESIFRQMNATIPAMTLQFFAASHLFNTFWWLPLVIVLGLFIAYKGWFVRSPVRRLMADRFKLRIPVVGNIIHKNAVVELSRTMSLLLRSGLSMLSTLELTRSAIHNRAVAESLQAVRSSVEQGAGLEAPLREAADVIPDVVTDMFVTGEETGSVDQVAEQIADVYEEEVQIAVAGLGEALLPFFIIVIAVVVILLVLSLYYPIISMIGEISSGGV